MYPAAYGASSYNESQNAQDRSQCLEHAFGIAKRQATLKDAWRIPKKPDKETGFRHPSASGTLEERRIVKMVLCD